MPRLLYPDLCPDCGYTLSRSRRRGWFEKLVARLIKVRVFRCHRCGARFYSPPAVIVRAPAADSHHVRELAPADEMDAPLVVREPDPKSALKNVVVKMSPASEKQWPTSPKIEHQNVR